MNKFGVYIECMGDFDLCNKRKNKTTSLIRFIRLGACCVTMIEEGTVQFKYNDHRSI